MNFENSKIMGGIGGILVFISFVPYTYGLLGLIGAILIIAAMKGFADYYKEEGIFNNALYSVILTIVGVVAFVAILFLALVDLLSTLGITIGLNTYTDLMTQLSSLDFTLYTNTFLKFAGFVFLDVVVLFVFALVAVLLLRKSLNVLSAKTDVHLFATTGTVLLVGAVLTIIFIGAILLWIGALMLAIAFFQIKSPPPPAAYSPPPMQPNPPSM
jgi:uncharacterized membrane protein